MGSGLCTLGAGMSGLEAQAAYLQYMRSKLFFAVSFSNILIGHSLGVDKPYPVVGGIFREEAIMLLRKFYVQENEKGQPNHLIPHTTFNN
jgi:hypothetical protein